MSTKIEKDRWVPVRRGDVYCSPACGGGCKVQAFNEANAQAAACAAQLWPGWVVRVYENLDWWWSVSSPCKRVTVSSDVSGQYSAFLAEEGPGGRWTAGGATPRAAVAAVVAELQKDVKQFMDLITKGMCVFDAVPKKIAAPRRRHSRSGQVRCDLCSPCRCRYAP